MKIAKTSGDGINGFTKSLLPYTKGMKAVEADSVEWVAGRSILAYGIRVGLRTNRPEMLEQLEECLPPLWQPSSVPLVERLFSFQLGGAGSRKSGRAYHQLFDDLESTVRSRDLNEVLAAFEVRLKLYVAEMARRRVFVHAGAIGWQGKAILIPGRSFSGKTSLVAELVRAGAAYYSDEYAVLDLQGRVHPYPQPLALRRPGAYRQTKRPVEELGGAAGTKPLPVGLVVVSRYQAGACWRPVRLSAGQAVLELLANTVPARRKPAVVMPTLNRATSAAIILKGVRGEAEETAGRILKMLTT